MYSIVYVQQDGVQWPNNKLRERGTKTKTNDSESSGELVEKQGKTKYVHYGNGDNNFYWISFIRRPFVPGETKAVSLFVSMKIPWTIHGIIGIKYVLG